MRLRLLVSLVTSATLLTGCGLQAERERLAAEQGASPLPTAGYYQPGAIGIPDAKAQGLGPSGQAEPSPSESATGAPSAEAKDPDQPLLDPVQKALDSVSLQQSDLDGDSRVIPIPGGTEVQGQVTLDLCGRPFPSEKTRVARRQVAAVDADGNSSGISSEAVFYSSPAAAAKAMAELAKARKECPTTPTSIDGEKTTITFHPAPGPTNTKLIPGAGHAVLHLTQSAPSSTFTVLAIYQQQGRLLVGFYVNQKGARPLAQDTLDSAFRFASKLAERMSEMPERELSPDSV